MIAMDLKAIWEMSDKWDGRQKPSMEEEYLVTKEESLDASIELYWGVIGICAADLNVSVEGLALTRIPQVTDPSDAVSV